MKKNQFYLLFIILLLWAKALHAREQISRNMFMVTNLNTAQPTNPVGEVLAH